MAFYPFNEATGTSAADLSGNEYTATMVGGASFTPGGLTGNGNAATMNGNGQYVSLPSGIVAGLTDFSVTAWVYQSAAVLNARVFDFGTGTTNYMLLCPNTSGGTRRVFGITTTGVSGELKVSGPAFATASWLHVAITLSGTLGTFYLNGSEAGTNASITLSPNSLGMTTKNLLGRSQFYPTDADFNGKIDNFRIYNRSLTAAEIAQIYKSKL